MEDDNDSKFYKILVLILYLCTIKYKVNLHEE